MTGNRFEDRSRIVITVETDRGALAALMDNPATLSPDDPRTPFANAVRRGVCHLRASAELTERESS